MYTFVASHCGRSSGSNCLKINAALEWCLFMSLTGFGADACLLSRNINFKNTYQSFIVGAKFSKMINAIISKFGSYVTNTIQNCLKWEGPQTECILIADAAIMLADYATLYNAITENFKV